MSVSIVSGINGTVSYIYSMNNTVWFVSIINNTVRFVCCRVCCLLKCYCKNCLQNESSPERIRSSQGTVVSTSALQSQAADSTSALPVFLMRL